MLDILFLWYCLCLLHDVRGFLLYTHYLNRYLKQWVFNKYSCWIHENNEWRVVSDWMDCYRHLAITALFLNESLPSNSLYLPPPSNFSSLTCLLDMFSICQFHAWSGSSNLHITSGLGRSHSWVRIVQDSFLAVPVLSSFSPFVLAPSPSTFPNTLALSTNALPRICPSSRVGKCLLLPQEPDPPFRSYLMFQKLHRYL